MAQGRNERSDSLLVGETARLEHEDEKVGAELLDRLFPFDAGGMDGGQGQDLIKLGFEASFVDFERGVVPCVAPPGFLASHADEMAQGGREDGVARVDDVLRIA